MDPDVDVSSNLQTDDNTSFRTFLPSLRGQRLSLRGQSLAVTAAIAGRMRKRMHTKLGRIPRDLVTRAFWQ
jgi:hypothetical protein